MRHTRRSNRISYTEPPANLDDLQLDDPSENSTNNNNNVRRTRHNTRRNRDIIELELKQSQLQKEEEEIALDFIRPTKRLKQYNNVDIDIDSSSKDSFNWRNYINDDILKNVDKTVLPNLPSDNIEIDILIKTWYYQFVMSWFNNVCDSYTTTILDSIKPLWKDIKFDEILFLNELIDNENEDKQLINSIKLKLLRLLMNTKKIELIDWDNLIKQQLNNYHPSHSYNPDENFINLPILKQFEIYYYIIKIIEIKSMTFKNYLNNNLNIFQFPTITNPQFPNLQIMIMPTLGSIVEINTITDLNKSKFIVPIKLKNCTIMKETLNEKELIHLDYSQEIDSYLNSIKIEYNVKAWDWQSFIKYIEDCIDDIELKNWLIQFIEIKITHLLYSSKLISQHEKTKQIAELMTRRKRSSRLVAREEETKQKEINDLINDKIDERDHFLKNRHRSLAKYNKRLKDIIWNLLWFKFDQDFKLIKLQDKNLNKLIENNEKLTPTDNKILNHGAYYTRSIIDISDESMYIHNNVIEKNSTIQEIPKELCLTTKDLELAKNNNIELNNINEPDNQDWIFHCICDDNTLRHFNSNKNDNSITENNKEIFNHKLICCDLCHIWEHWDCQPQENIDYLSQMHIPAPKKGSTLEPIKQLYERDFAIVVLGKLNKNQQHQHNLRNEPQEEETGGTYRRSARLATVEQEQLTEEEQEQEQEQADENRPTDLRSRYGQSSPYICGFCMKLLENELRSIFVPELEIIRFKQRKGHDDRERRKQKKIEKEKLKALTQSKEAVSPPVNILSINNTDNNKTAVQPAISSPLFPIANTVNNTSTTTTPPPSANTGFSTNINP